MKLKLVLIVLSIIAIAASYNSGIKDNSRPPNILYIMADDHTANAISAYNLRYAEVLKTPNIDRLAEEGAMLTNCFVTNSICTPSRATILTGKYGHLNGVYTLWDDFDSEQQNVAMLLQDAGYETAIIGKWHLHTKPNGFDFFSVLPGQGKYFNPVFREMDQEWVLNGKEGTTYEGYATDIIADKTITWLKNRDESKPFFLMSHHKAPHGLWEYAPRFEHLFDGVDIPEPESLFEDKSHRSEGSREFGRDMLDLSKRMSEGNKGRGWPTGLLDVSGMNEEEIIRATYQKYLKDYLRVVAAIDENVGRVLDYIDEAGLAENTIVIYTSDQGMFLGEHQYYDKRWIFEEGIQMPFLIRYPGEIEAGTVCNDMVTNLDFAELFLDYAGVDIPADMQGRSFRPNLEGKTPKDWRTSMYYRYWMQIEGSAVPAHYGIRTEDFKLIHFYGKGLQKKGTTVGWDTPDTWELYDLQKDPYEVKNEFENPEYSEVIKELKAELYELKEGYGDKE
ncbi:sulfatase [Bacteroidota bacterium]